MNIKMKINKILKKLHLIDETKYYKKIGVKIGKNCKLYHNNLDEGHGYLLEIGNNCIITHCTILTHDASTKLYTGKTKVGKVTIGDNCFIGMQTLILPNVTIGDNCIIGAGSIVTKNIESNSVVAGNPAKLIMKTNQFIEKHKEYMKTKPVFEKSWTKKTNNEKCIEKEKLLNTWGYDE